MVVWNFQGGYPLGPPLNEITGPYMPKKAILPPCITSVITLESTILLLITRDIRADERRGGKSLQLNVWVASSCAKDSAIFRTSCVRICMIHDHDPFRLGHVSQENSNAGCSKKLPNLWHVRTRPKRWFVGSFSPLFSHALLRDNYPLCMWIW